jgi:hypothetical protein
MTSQSSQQFLQVQASTQVNKTKARELSNKEGLPMPLALNLLNNHATVYVELLENTQRRVGVWLNVELISRARSRRYLSILAS